MKCIVPLAGGDLAHPVHGFRPWFPVADGQPVLQAALDQRAWRNQLAGSDFIFVLREVAGLDRLEDWLETKWPGCGRIRLPRMTGGAMFTAMAGVALLPADDEPVIVDLADILFSEGAADPAALFISKVGAIIPCFASDEPCYSYLRLEEGRVVEAAEKRVISRNASAGVYMFRDRATYLGAALYAIAHAENLTYQGIHFVCPMANGVIAGGQEVLAPIVHFAVPVGKIFHQGTS